MTRLLCEINDIARSARTAGAHAIGQRLLGVYRNRYTDIITAGKAANPTPPGHGARSPAVNLLARLGGFATDVLRFAHDLRVPFDNNLAERDIRMVKLRQKISGGLRTWTGAETFCAIRSYLATARKHSINALEALTDLPQWTYLDAHNQLNSYPIPISLTWVHSLDSLAWSLKYGLTIARNGAAVLAPIIAARPFSCVPAGSRPGNGDAPVGPVRRTRPSCRKDLRAWPFTASSGISTDGW
ncbi:transposase [Dactylosporangium sp. NPDC051485]|uniref:IS66 family transposase n=1 Tax=Dactylosporangium sp. NPDC051485 TaxID=3154846 RepID=UPI003424046E